MNTITTLARNIIEFAAFVAVCHEEDTHDAAKAIREIEYDTLYQNVRREAGPVYRCRAESIEDDLPVFSSEKLFDQDATLICRVQDRGYGIDDMIDCQRFHELWIMEDMSIRLVSCFTMSYDSDAYFMEYRQDQGTTFPAGNVWLDFDDLMDALAGFWDVDPDEAPPMFFEP